MEVRLPLALACVFGTLVVSATPAFAVEPVVLVATDKPEYYLARLGIFPWPGP